MAQIKSAQKRARQTQKRTARNQHLKRLIRDANQNLKSTIIAGQKASIAKARSEYDRLIDRALKKNLIKKNKAARKKSQAANLAKAASATKSRQLSSKTAKTGASKKTAPKKTTASKKTTPDQSKA